MGGTIPNPQTGRTGIETEESVPEIETTIEMEVVVQETWAETGGTVQGMETEIQIETRTETETLETREVMKETASPGFRGIERMPEIVTGLVRTEEVVAARTSSTEI